MIEFDIGSELGMLIDNNVTRSFTHGLLSRGYITPIGNGKGDGWQFYHDDTFGYCQGCGEYD